jgi:ubiquinone/menaquinone biosynthesis C-methylase UbiE
MAVLAEAFRGVDLTGVDIEARQLEFARRHLAEAGVTATLIQADALALPFDDRSFDHVWMMWFLEHLADPVAALREARRVLAAGGAITAIEVDYSTCHADPSTANLEALFSTMVQGMAARGRSDAGTHLPRWLSEAGFGEVDPGERRVWWEGAELERQANYAADVMESALGAMVELPGAPGEQQLRRGLAELRGLVDQPDSGLGWTIHKSHATR